VAPRQPTPSKSLAEILSRAWSLGRVGAVLDRELTTAVDLLMQTHVKNGFFGHYCDGMRRVQGFGADGSMEVALVPMRTQIPIARESSCQCPLCSPPNDVEKGLAWRGYQIWPNAFPYLPTDQQHILLTSAGHRGQAFSTQLLNDVLDFQAFTAGSRPLTMFYNGTAGNSQYHLHWQAVRETVPLERLIARGALCLTSHVKEADGELSSFDQGSYAGFMVSGNKRFVCAWARTLVQHLKSDPLTQGAYNMGLLSQQNGNFRLVIVPRRAACLKPNLGSLGPRGVGAFNMLGTQVLPKDEIPADFSDALTHLRDTLVPPCEFAWLATLKAPAKLPMCEATQRALV